MSGAGNAPAVPGTANIAAREAAAMLGTYRRQPVEFVSGAGMWLTDAVGERHLDFLSGLSVTSLGHAHPAVTEAVTAQVGRLVHTSNLFYSEPQVQLAERLRETLGWSDGQAFLCNSGAEANEAAIKLARRHGKREHPDKVQLVALSGSFHGRTLATLAATGNPAKHEPFEPLGDWVTHVPHDDPDALAAAVDDGTSAVLLEAVQGEGGCRPVPAEVWQAARDACDRVGALLIADEVQTGLGRLGAWYGWQQTGVTPDVVTLAKALANGLPIGAAVSHGQAVKALRPGDHATTFGGGPVVCAAALAVLDTLESDELIARAARLGTNLRDRLHDLAGSHDLVGGVRGRGLLQAVVLTRPVAGAVVSAALRRRLVVNDVAPDAVRLAPPLILDETHLDEFDRRFGAALDDVARAQP